MADQAREDVRKRERAEATTNRTGWCDVWVFVVGGVFGLVGTALIAFGALAGLSLFFPAVTIMGQELGWFDDPFAEEATLLMVACAIVIGFGLLLFFVKATWARITAGLQTLLIVIGILAAIDGFANASNLSDTRGAEPGMGLYILGFMGLLMIVLAVISFLPAGQKAKAVA